MTEKTENNKEYRLSGEPALRLFNHQWNAIKGDSEIEPLIDGGYNSFSYRGSLFDAPFKNLDSMHLIKIRSRSHGPYGSMTYGEDRDVIFCVGSLVQLHYEQVNPDFNIPKEEARCRIVIISDNPEHNKKTKERLENICGQELMEKK